MTAPDLLLQLALFAGALLANLLSALAGGGAGLVQLPLLILLGLPFPLALATHKLASVALGVGATLRHARERSLNLRFALLTIGLGIYSLCRPNLGTQAQARAHGPAGLLLGGLVLFAIGVLNGSLTSGTGLFVTLWLVRWFGLDYGRAVAYTLILVGLFWNGTGALTLGLQGQIAWRWVPALLLGSVVGGYLGAHLAIARGSRLVKRCFEVLSLLMGTSLLFKAMAW